MKKPIIRSHAMFGHNVNILIVQDIIVIIMASNIKAINADTAKHFCRDGKWVLLNVTQFVIQVSLRRE